MKKLTFILILLLFVLASHAGDILTLNNRMVFEGKVTKIKGCHLEITINGDKYSIPASEIFSVEFQNPGDKVYADYLKLAASDISNCMKGGYDASAYHGKKAGHFILGFLFGPFAMVGTVLSNPVPERGQSTYKFSKNRDLFDDAEYIACYRKKAKLQLIGMEALGWGASIIFLITINAS